MQFQHSGAKPLKLTIGPIDRATSRRLRTSSPSKEKLARHLNA